MTEHDSLHQKHKGSLRQGPWVLSPCPEQAQDLLPYSLPRGS